ncbi:unnamed protein product [Paramecium sonneborni]|uniref:Protein kinase domain-containing protein n=1 Tax=Paramecium sonneborni TaxID=65129 RepID=A0A8S1Q695_9CILI|nr:unnamed protein product [Paramecium sonneborni]
MTTQIKVNSKKFQDFYKIKKDIFFGEGYFGQVYACEKIDDPDKQKYCVKIIPIAQKKKDVKGSKYEEVISTALKNYSQNKKEFLNFVQIYDTFKNDEELYIVMEQCDEDLSKEFERMQKKNIWYTEEEVFNIIRQTITGFQQLYNLNIIHRDIKPENILIKKEKNSQKKIYKIGDFGVGRLVEDINNQDEKLTRIGTLNYMSPQLIYNEIATAKCDIFSYGILFYQICYKGELPYDCSSIIKFNKSLTSLKEKPFKTPPLGYSRADVLKDLIEKMIVYEESQRASFEEIFNHQVMFVRGIQETQLFSQVISSQLIESNINLNLNQQSQQEKNKIQAITQDFQMYQRLLEVFYNRFKICSYFNQQIDCNQQNYYLHLIIYLIAKQQLEYALAIIYIRPQDIHPIILEDNHELSLIQKLYQIQTALQDHRQNFFEFLDYRQLIQATFHKFLKKLFAFQNEIQLKLVNSAIKQDEEFVKIIRESQFQKIEISQLIKSLKNIQKSKSISLQKDLQELLDKIIDFDNKYPISLYKSDIDLKEIFPFQIQSYIY